MPENNSVPEMDTPKRTNAPATGVVSAVVVDSPRFPVSIAVERMTRGPAKVSVRIDGADAHAVAEEVLRVYGALVLSLGKLEPAAQSEKDGAS